MTEEADSAPTLTPPPETRAIHLPESNEAYFSSKWLIAIIAPHPQDESFLINGKQFTIPQDTLVGTIDFLPNRHSTHQPDSVTPNLLLGFEALHEFTQHLHPGNSPVPQGKIPQPVYLIGSANRHIAQVAKKLGFLVIDDQEDKDYQVKLIAKTSDVVQAVHALSHQRTRGDKLLIDQLHARVARASSAG